MEIFLETVKVLTSSFSKYAASMVASATARNHLAHRMVLSIGRARHNAAVRRKLSGKFFNFERYRENADTKVEVIVKPIEDDAAINLGADLIADILLMSLMFIYMFYSLHLRRKKFRDLCNTQKEHEQFILARLAFLEGELHKLQQPSTPVQ
ncbi:hypothetical protein BBOV_III007275 [Babesia bovis T2Bo]|uniref:hypothetical protein n=1 Tax=Babesia bovis T2Bo TaxID=484906 RepID=UPI001C35FC06|nr:hypothetical protein BBOV_III007275 [Babesia bovis T2Bo]KAG6440000.1 hypothetical protein BBOV_III007275 [Babesia bovis T2Bo]